MLFSLFNKILMDGNGDLGIPATTTDDLIGRINAIVAEFDKLLSGVALNIAAIALIICIIGFIVIGMIFKVKAAEKVLASAGFILLGIILLAMRWQIIGWFKTLANLGS